MPRILTLIALVVVGCLAWHHLSVQPPLSRLDYHLDRFEELESARLSAAAGKPVRVTITIDRILTSYDDDAYPLRAVVHFKRDDREYDRPCLRYSRKSEAWEWEPGSQPAAATRPSEQPDLTAGGF